MFYKKSTSPKIKFSFLCIFLGGALMFFSSCAKNNNVQQVPFESLDTKEPFSLSVKYKNTIIKTGETLDVFCI